MWNVRGRLDQRLCQRWETPGPPKQISKCQNLALVVLSPSSRNIRNWNLQLIFQVFDGGSNNVSAALRSALNNRILACSRRQTTNANFFRKVLSIEYFGDPHFRTVVNQYGFSVSGTIRTWAHVYLSFKCMKLLRRFASRNNGKNLARTWDHLLPYWQALMAVFLLVFKLLAICW